MGTLLWLVCCVLLGYHAHLHGRNGWIWGGLSVLFSPLIVGILYYYIYYIANRED